MRDVGEKSTFNLVELRYLPVLHFQGFSVFNEMGAGMNSSSSSASLCSGSRIASGCMRQRLKQQKTQTVQSVLSQAYE
jgi:hypothetical protein